MTNVNRMLLRRIGTFVVVLAAFLGLAACGGGGGGSEGSSTAAGTTASSGNTGGTGDAGGDPVVTPPSTVVLSAAISGQGTVAATNGTINCPGVCSESLATGTSVTLTATPAANYTFSGWSGACTGTGACVVAMDAAKSVTANFASITSRVLTVGLSGSGSVTSSPAGISCGSDCTQAYTSGTVVTLTANVGSGATFGGWSGSCSGNSTTCSVTMSSARSVTASFATAPSSGAMELPVSGQAATLVRYPFLQVAGSPTSLRIVWATSSSGTSQVQYRLAAGGNATTVTASQVQYPSATTGIATFYQQEALVTGLVPGGSYLYDVIHNGTAVARNIPFVALRDSTATTVNFIAFGDSGTQYSTPRAVRDRIALKNANGDYVHPHDFVVSVGDIAYTAGTYAEYNANFFDQMSGRGDRGNGDNSILATRPYVPALGNHDYVQSYANTPSGYLGSFVLPTSGVPAADAERYYSFDSGDAHFVVLDSMKFDFNGSSESANRLQTMLDWLDADLAATTKTWRIAILHHAIFSVSSHGTWGDIGQNARMRQKLAPILQNHGVQLALIGHDHIYQRTKRIMVDGNGKIVRTATCNGTTSNVVESNSGIVYIVAGNGGDDLHNSQVDTTKVCGDPTGSYADNVANYGDGYDFVAMNGSTPALVAANTTSAPARRHGFTHVSIAGSTMTITAYTYEGVVLDQNTMSAH